MMTVYNYVIYKTIIVSFIYLCGSVEEKNILKIQNKKKRKRKERNKERRRKKRKKKRKAKQRKKKTNPEASTIEAKDCRARAKASVNRQRPALFPV